MISNFKTSAALSFFLTATACASSSNEILPVPERSANSEASKSESSGALPGTPAPSLALQAASLDEIVAELSKSATRLVDRAVSPAERIPGLVVGVVTENGSKVVGFGTTRALNGNVPNGDTYFGIGSVTKVFTGLVLAEVVQNGSVRLDDKANEYLPAALQLPSDAITLQQLVTHASGLPNYPGNLSDFRDNDNDGMADSTESSPGRNYARQNLADWLATKPALGFNPGASARYSNLGIGVLGLLLQEKLNLGSFDAMMSDRITKPLGMSRTQANTPEMQSENLVNKAQGYSEGTEPKPMPFADMGVLDGSGELVSTANDMNKFLEGLVGISQTALTPAFKEANRSLASFGENKMAYASAIAASSKGGTYAFKPGGTPGYSAIILWRTHPKVGIVVMANRGGSKANDKVNNLGKVLNEASVR
jgi:D-alanyl-D-alanine-carboxypeptidase/D-alanyl-D-alanine-endopeptidase